MTPPDEQGDDRQADLSAKPVLEWTAEEWEAWIETTRVPVHPSSDPEPERDADRDDYWARFRDAGAGPEERPPPDAPPLDALHPAERVETHPDRGAAQGAPPVSAPTAPPPVPPQSPTAAVAAAAATVTPTAATAPSVATAPGAPPPTAARAPVPPPAPPAPPEPIAQPRPQLAQPQPPPQPPPQPQPRRRHAADSPPARRARSGAALFLVSVVVGILLAATLAAAVAMAALALKRAVG